MNTKNTNVMVDQCSLLSVYVEVMVRDKSDQAGDLVLSKATGFVFENFDNKYFVSNWHVFSGRNAITLEPLDTKYSALPEFLRIYFPLEGELGKFETVELNLKSDDNEYCWRQHKEKNHVDVALMPVELKSNYATFPVNTINESRGLYSFPEKFYVGQEVFVLGYPLGIERGGGFPIWKRATIATEPYLEIDQRNSKILIDTATRPGMSGSPVISASHPSARILFDGRCQPVNIRASKLFLGVYSGRLGNDDLAAQLGVVWKENVIKEIIKDGIPYSE
jgi:S1-C subfamily serine protease